MPAASQRQPPAGYRALPRAASAAAVLVALAWWLARLLAERWSTVQWAAWVGIEWAAFATSLLAALAWLLHRSDRRRPSNRRTSPPRLGLIVALLLVALTARAWNLHRLVLPAATRTPSDVRIGYLNLSAQDVHDWPALADRMDIVFVANRPSNADLQPAWSWISGDETTHDAAVIGRCAVMSRLPVRRWGLASIDFSDVWSANIAAARPEPAWAAWFQFEQASGEPLTVWVVDLPSPIELSRTLAVDRLLERVRSWSGTAYATDAAGLRTTEPGASFPMPDVIVGDFNTPRWSRALPAIESRLDVREVSARIGIGPAHTFGSPVALWPIDLFYSSGAWKPTAHSTVRLDGLRHRAITATFTPAP